MRLILALLAKQEGRVIPYRLKIVDWGVDEDGKPVSTCTIRWETQRPLPKKRARGRPRKTNTIMDMAIAEVGLPADVEVLKQAFYRIHGGNTHAANRAWNRALESGEVGFFGGKLDQML